MLRERMQMLRKKYTDSVTTVDSMLEQVKQALASPREGFLEDLGKLEDQVNHYELELDFYCTSIISLYAPEAKDLRTVLMILKMNSDVERIGDLLFGIGKVVKQLQETGEKVDPELLGLLTDAGSMFTQTGRAFLDEDETKASSVLQMDDAIDSRRHVIIGRMLETIAKDPTHVQRYYSNIKITQKIERIADHSTNIAEDVIYMLKATSVKHHHDEGHGQK